MADIQADLVGRNSLCIGISGLDCSGKTSLTETLKAKLEQNAVRVEQLHVDDFNNQSVQAEVYGKFVNGHFNQHDVDHYYQNSVDYVALLRAIQAQKVFAGVLLVEGVFLFKPPLGALFDKKVFLQTSYANARKRYELRKSKVGDNRPIEVFDDIWVPTYERYCGEHNVLNLVDCIIQT